MADVRGALLGTKLHVPRARAGTVARHRLTQRLPREALPPLTLLSAPAGFGKTTLAVAGLGADARVGWVSLDGRDSEPRTFWSYVATALDRVEPGVGEGALAALRLLSLREVPTTHGTGTAHPHQERS